jgi:hypothetical protein
MADKPTAAFRAGPIRVAVFMNKRKVKGKDVEIPSVSFQKRYLAGDEWKSTSSLDMNDVPKAVLALTKCFDYLVGLKTVGPSENESPGEEPVEQ